MCPPNVRLRSLPGKLSAEIDMLLDTKWREWAEGLYDGAKRFGIVPYYYESIPGTVHKFPVVPTFGTYSIVTYVDARGAQHFKCYSTGRGASLQAELPGIKWWYESRSALPTIGGQYQSPMVTVLRDMRTARILREALEIGAHQAVRPVHVIESHPSKANTGDDELTALESFGEKIAGLVVNRTEALRSNKIHVKTAELASAIQSAHAANVGNGGGGNVYDRTETSKEAFERENSGFLTRLIPLPPDRAYKTAAGPSLLGDLDEVEKRIDANISSIMDFPRELVQPQSSVRGTNVQGNLRFWNERQKYWMGLFSRVYKTAIIDIYGDMLQLGLDTLSKRRKSFAFEREAALYVATDLEVEFSCSPIATFEDFAALHAFGEQPSCYATNLILAPMAQVLNWSPVLMLCCSRVPLGAGIIKKETVGAYMLHQYGIPATDLHVTKEPDMMPSLADQEKAKGDAKMDLEKFKLKEKNKIKPATV